MTTEPTNLPAQDARTVIKPMPSSPQKISASGIPAADTQLINTTKIYPRTKPPAEPTQPAHHTDRSVTIGDLIKDRFVLDKLLGTGGMGAVFRALDLRKKEAGDTRPYVALKILGEDFKNHPDALVTLQREARKTQDLAHPNIVTVYDFDREGDLVYLTMEELKGRALADLLADKNTQLNFNEKISLLRQIAQGLAYAHSKGLVHSDLKPANIFVTEKNDVKILDFGIARATNSTLYEDNFDAGQLGAITLAYASLEMLRFEPPHPSDDIYALGIIACELFNHQHPYNRKDAQTALAEKLKPHLPQYRNPLLNKIFINTIALERSNRIADAEKFLTQLQFALSAPKRLGLLLIILSTALLANFMYLQQVTPTSIKLKDLPITAQTNFKNYINEATLALSYADLQGAVFNLDQAFKIHQTDKALLEIRDNIIQIETQNFESATTPEEKTFYEAQLAQLKTYPVFSTIKANATKP
jgi:serine/threonine protein kinase